MSKKSSVRGYYSTRTTKLTTFSSKHSQSALEYMMTYGWAILIIVIVAAGLYSLGIFNPSSSAGTTITGFSGLGTPQSLCMQDGGLRLQLGNSQGYTINITRINITSNGITNSITPNQLISPQGTYIFYIPNVCGTSSGSRYSFTSTITYTEPGQAFGGPYSSSGTASGTVSSTVLPSYVTYFNGINANFHSYTSQVSSKITFTFWEFFPSQPAFPTVLFLNFTNSGWNGPNTLDSYLWGAGGGQPVVNLVLYAENSSDKGIANGNFGTQVGGWHFISFEATDTWIAFFIDNVMGYNQSTSSPVNVGPVSLQVGSSGWAKIYLYNLQIYNSILSTTQLDAFYSAGLGVISTDSGLSSEWPLNGTAKDFSGNGNNGIASNVVYTSNYPAP